MTARDRCPVCPDPRCPVRPGTQAMAYHWLAMLREAYARNGTPRSDAVLMGLAGRVPVRCECGRSWPDTALGRQARAWHAIYSTHGTDCGWPDAQVVMFTP